VDEPRAEEVLAHLPHYFYVFDFQRQESRFLGRPLGLDLGYSAEQLAEFGPDFLPALLHPEDLARIPQLLVRWDTVDDEQIVETEHRLRRADGEWRWFLGRDRVLRRDADGRVSHIVGTSFDITDRKILEARVVTEERLEALTLLAGGVAHDLNNLVTVIFGHVDFLAQSAGPEAAEDLGAIRRAGHTAAELTRKLLAFAREQDLAPELVELNQLVAGSLDLLKGSLGEIQLERDLQPGLGPALVDCTQLEQVVMNLVLNARDALGAAGHIKVSTKALASNLGRAAAQRRFVRLTVADDGPGLTEEARGRVFEPFFTTKPAGTGMGLATVYGIVRQSGGEIMVESDPGQGAVFHVDLPMAGAAVGEGTG
jgi:PAS domain S-box-containing protein